MADTKQFETGSNGDHRAPGPNSDVRGFTPTDYELLVLAKHWERAALEIRFFWFICPGIAVDEADVLTLASRRISRIAETIGYEVVRQAVEEVWKTFGAKVDPRAWDVFRYGDREQVKAFQEEVAQGKTVWRMGSGPQRPIGGGATELAFTEQTLQEQSLVSEAQDAIAQEMLEQKQLKWATRDHELWELLWESFLDSGNSNDRHA